MESWMTVYNWPVLRCPRLAGFEVSPEAFSAARYEKMKPSRSMSTNRRPRDRQGRKPHRD
jgi:hypothetical protein